MKKVFELFYTFFKIGLFTFGGGYAMLPIIEREVVDKHKWSSKEEVLDIFSMSQCTPGVIAVNAATFIGNKIGGIIGALFATLGVVTPSTIIITIIAAFFSNVAEKEYVIHAFGGVRIVVAALILKTCINMFKSAIRSSLQLGVAIASFLTVTFLGASPIIVVIVSGLFGLFFLKLPKDKEADEIV